MCPGEPRRVVLRGFLVGFDEEDDVASQRHLPLRQLHDGTGEDGHSAFEVDGSASVDVAVLDHPGERVDRPLLALDADHVGVRGEQHRPLASVAFQTRNQVRLPRLGSRHDRDLEPERPQPRRQQLVERPFIAGRIAGIETDDVLQQRSGRIDGLRGRAGAQERQQRHENSNSGWFHETYGRTNEPHRSADTSKGDGRRQLLIANC
ncbi:MAG: hypothetical protein QM736_25050 [Vicinamibacterales bacterium]